MKITVDYEITPSEENIDQLTIIAAQLSKVSELIEIRINNQDKTLIIETQSFENHQDKDSQKLQAEKFLTKKIGYE